MKIAVYHDNFSSAGGAEVFAVKTVKALKEIGNQVDIYTCTVKEDSLMQILDNSNISLTPHLLKCDNSLVYKTINFIEKMHSLTLFWEIEKAINKYPMIKEELKSLKTTYDLIITDDFYSMIPGDIIYFHFPYPVFADSRLTLNNSYDKVLIKRIYKDFLKNRIDKAIEKFKVDTLKDWQPFKLVANSTWTKNHMINIFSELEAKNHDNSGIDLTLAANISRIIYGPVDYETLSENYDPFSKENLVLTVSRLEPGKNLWSVIEIASRIKHANFIIAGTTKTPNAFKVLDNLEDLIDRLKVKNVSIMKDASRKVMIELYKKAKIYLHPLYIEHFGIAIAEGASSGAVPVVYRDGGGWLDIASRVNDNLGYTNLDEAVNVVKKLIDDNNYWLNLSRKSVSIAKDFSWTSFKSRWNNVIEEIYRTKINK